MGTEDSDGHMLCVGAFRMVTKEGYLEERHSAEPGRMTRADPVKEETDSCSGKWGPRE